MTVLEQFVFDKVGRRTAVLAKAKADATLATNPDNAQLLQDYLDDGILKTLIHIGVLNHNTTTLEPSTDYGELIFAEQWESLVHYVMGRWYVDIGQPQLGEVYLKFSGLPTDSNLRFHKKTAVRPYR